MKNSVKIFIMACAAACAGSSFAAETIKQSFETTSSLTPDAGGVAVSTVGYSGAGGVWNGDGVVTNSSTANVIATTTYPASHIGCPISGSSVPTVGNFLVVDGACVCTNDTGSSQSYYSVDYLVNLVEPCGILLEESEDEALKGVQIAVAAGTAVTDDSVPFCVYCRTNSMYNSSANKTNGWIATTETVSTGKWHRVRLTFDYLNSRCLVALDGIPAASEYGYANPTSTVGSAKGAWYPLASPTTGSNKITELQLLGLGRFDELKICSDTTHSASAGTEAQYNGAKVPAVPVGDVSAQNLITYQDLNKWGVSTNSSSIGYAKADGSGLTVSEKLQCGLDPTDGKVFEVTSMTANGNTATLTVPRTYNATNGNGYKVQYAVTVNGSAGTLSDANAEGADGKATLTVSGLSDDTAGVNMIVVTATAANP